MLPEKVSGSHVSDDLRDREDDVIWRVKWGDKWLYVYLLLEFQSTVDTFMSVRIMTYLGLLYQDLIRTGQLTPAGKLPPVLPVVLYNGGRRWKAATEINELIEVIPGGLKRYSPHLSYLLLDEGSYSESELEPLVNLSAALFRLENSRSREDIQRVLITLTEWLSDPKQTSLRRAFTVWIKRVILPARLPEAEIPEVNDLQEVKAMLAERVVEWTKEWKEEGLRKGRREGRREGRKEGVKEGESKLLIRLVEHKFGKLSEKYYLLIQSANTDSLQKYAERVLTAATMSEVFEER